MRKRIANVCVIAILVYGIFSCTQTTGDTLAAEKESKKDDPITVIAKVTHYFADESDIY